MIKSPSLFHEGIRVVVKGVWAEGEKSVNKIGVDGFNLMYASITGAACSYSPRDAQ